MTFFFLLFLNVPHEGNNSLIAFSLNMLLFKQFHCHDVEISNQFHLNVYLKVGAAYNLPCKNILYVIQVCPFLMVILNLVHLLYFFFKVQNLRHFFFHCCKSLLKLLLRLIIYWVFKYFMVLILSRHGQDAHQMLKYQNK